MKLVREHIYEAFSEKGDPVRDMGIGQRHLIIKWFEDAERQSYKINYEIDNNLNIFVEGNLWLKGTEITELPDNLTVGGDLDLQYTKITKLPDNLTVNGNLDLEDTLITELPNNLSVGRWLDLQGTKITELPKDLKVKGKIYKDF